MYEISESRLKIGEGKLARAGLVYQPLDFYVIEGTLVRLEDKTELVSTAYNFEKKAGYCDCEIDLVDQLIKQCDAVEEDVTRFRKELINVRAKIQNRNRESFRKGDKKEEDGGDGKD